MIRMKCRFICDHRRVFRVVSMHRVLELTRSGFHQRPDKPEFDRKIQDRRLPNLIRDFCDASVCGARRLLGDRRETGVRRGKHRVKKIMPVQKIKARRGRSSVCQPLEEGSQMTGHGFRRMAASRLNGMSRNAGAIARLPGAN